MSLPGNIDKALDIARRRGFFWPAYETYGGSAGLFVFGDNGVKTRENIASVWRETFVKPHEFFEIDGPEIVPEQVLQASGHVANFKDPMAECLGCHRKFRADHLLADAGIPVGEGAPSEIICLTCETSTVMPRSLNEPLWVLPQSLIHRSFTPTIFPKRSAQKRFVLPS